jgi:hypothetical protein
VPIAARGPGVYQVAVTGFGGEIEMQTTPRLSFGVYVRLALVDATTSLPPRASSCRLA